MHISAILLILSFVCFVLAALNVPVKINLVATGLALWVITVLLGTWIA